MTEIGCDPGFASTLRPPTDGRLGAPCATSPETASAALEAASAPRYRTGPVGRSAAALGHRNGHLRQGWSDGRA